MNKLLIVLLAVCLISVHAFVKRDAPPADNSQQSALENIQKQLQDLANSAKELVEKALDPQAIQQGIQNINNTVTDLVNKLQPTQAPAKPQ